MYFDEQENIFGDQPITLFAGISAVIGLVLVLVVRFFFAKNIDLAAAVTWAMLGNLLGLGFAAISDIWINGYSPAVADRGRVPALRRAEPDLRRHPGAAAGGRLRRRPAPVRSLTEFEGVVSAASPPKQHPEKGTVCS